MTRVVLIATLVFALILGSVAMVDAAGSGIVIVKSEYTRDYYMSIGASFTAYWGAVEQLMWTAGYEYDVLTDEDVENGKLDPKVHKLLILTSQNNMSEAEAKAIIDYVKAGGALFTGYNHGLRDEDGKDRRQFPLAEVIGVGLVTFSGGASQKLGKYGFMQVQDPSHPIFKNLPKEIPFPKHYAVIVKAQPGTTILAKWLDDSKAPSREDATNGALFLKGKVFYGGGLLFDPDMGVADTPEIQKLVKNVIDYLLSLQGS